MKRRRRSSLGSRSVFHGRRRRVGPVRRLEAAIDEQARRLDRVAGLLETQSRALDGLSRDLLVAAALADPRHPDAHRAWTATQTAWPASVSVILPVKDAGPGFVHLLSMLRRQRGVQRLEVVVVDSGSTDGSLELAREMGATVISIPPESFSHSGARLTAAAAATGDYLLFTVQDALPPHDTWVRELLAAMAGHGASAISCAEFPREDADLYYRFSLWRHYQVMGHGDDKVMALPPDGDPVALRGNCQLYDTACLIPRELYLRYGHRGDYAEDLDLGLRLVHDGHRLAFTRATYVIHSHNRPAFYYLKRACVEALAVARILGPNPHYEQPERLLAHTGACFALLERFACSTLSWLALPCSVADVAGLLREEFARLPEAGPCCPPAGSPDGELDGFLAAVRRLQPPETEPARIAAGSLFRSMQISVDLTLDYLAQAYDVLDAGLVEELKSHLGKALASLVGTHLADSMTHCPGWAQPELAALRARVTRGV